MPESVTKLFEGRTRTEFRTLNGQQLDVVDAPFLSLDLDVMQSRTLPDSIRHLCERETLRGENSFFNSRSGRKVDAVFSMVFIQAPPILVCHLRRFDFDSNSSTRQKVDDRFEFDFDITLPNVDVHYALTGVVLHCETAEGGHCRALVRSSCDNAWLDLDDAHVADLSEAALLSQSVGGFSRGWNAYLLFYTRSDVVKKGAVRLEDVPVALRAGFAPEEDAKLRQFAGLASPPAVDFMRRMPSQNLRFQYFLRILCHSQQLDLAGSFACEVFEMPTQYEVHFRDIVFLIDENEGLADVFIRVLLSGVSDALIHCTSAFAGIIAQKRHTVEWFGKLLLRSGRECPAAMDILSDVAANYPERGDDLSGYLQAVLTSGESDPRTILPLLPLLTQNNALLEPVIRVLANSGMSWSDIQRAVRARNPTSTSP
jgi:hypothetical protein